MAWDDAAAPSGIPGGPETPEPSILDGEIPSRKEADVTRVRNSLGIGTPPARRGRCLGLVAACLLAAAAAAPAAEMLAASASSITAEDAARHVAALADDAFEGREGGARGGQAAGTYIVEQIAPLGFEPAGDAGSYFQRFGAGLRNILALLPGRDPELAGEVVVIGAHYDHVGYGNERNSFGPFGFVHNGADDNASGVAGLIEIMEALRRLPERPRRSILIAFWDGEEKGLLGSRHFLRVRPEPLVGRPLVFSLNLDMIGRLRDERVVVYGARTAPGLRAWLAATNSDPATGTGLDLAFEWDIVEDSDHYPFIAARIPTLMLHTGLHDQYHRPSDDAELVNFAGIPAVSRLALAAIAAQADAPERPVFREAAPSESNATRRRLEETRPPQGPSQGRWGIVSRTDPGEPATPIVVDVARGSPADQAGLRPGDRIHSVDGERFADQAGMVRRLQGAARSCRVVADRRGQLIQLTLEASAD
jgi:hypothetical protein